MAKVFIVDDSKISRRILRSVLEEHGHTVVGEAGNGQEAVDNFQEHNPDIITLDITMPIMDGIVALHHIKQICPNVKAIMITAAGQNDKVVQAVKYGASEFLSKPFEPEQIIEAINKVLR